MGKQDARIHTGRSDSDGSSRGTCRCPAGGVPTFYCSTCGAEGLEEKAAFKRALDRHFAARAAAEAWDESVDGLHSRDEG